MTSCTNGITQAAEVLTTRLRLIKGQTRKLILILDNLRVHHARQVKAWLAEHSDAIEVFYLPSYSPELNPDEMANADIKQAVTTLAPARTKMQLVKTAAKHLRSVSPSASASTSSTVRCAMQLDASSQRPDR